MICIFSSSLKMSKGGFFLTGLTTLVLLLCYPTSCRAQNKSVCSPSSCGDIKISYPFRLRTDPANCGHPDTIFVLECNRNQTILHSKSRRYHVEAITYSNFSIRISDPGLDSNNYSSCPIYSSTDNDFYSRYMALDYTNSIVITYLNCLSPVSNPSYIENPFCGNTSAFSNSSTIHSYVTVESILVSDMEENCTYDTMAYASSPYLLKDSNYSYRQIHDFLTYGIEVSWFQAMCTECDESKGTCVLEDNKIRCRHYCYEDTPLSERTFGCKLEYYAIYLFLVAVAIGGLIGLRLLCGISFLIGLVVYKGKRRDLSMNQSEIIEELLRQQIDLVPINYSYGEIKKMTRNFKAKLGEGIHGTVFKGKLRSGPSVAVKMLMKSSSSDQEFIRYVSRISRISHPNVAKLIGFCIEGKKRALVHEFIQHGSLEKHVFGEMKNSSLSYEEMFKISLGIALGIACLHDSQIFHPGIKPQNILLDEDFNPKILDSGLAKLYYLLDDDRRVGAVGKMGFIAPEVFYRNIGDISDKVDVYSFGMLVLDLAARLKSINPYAKRSGHIYFPWWIYKQLSDGKELENIGEEEKRMVKKMVLVALWCIQMRPGDRPTMREAVAMLEGGIELLQIPPMPFQRAMDDESF